MGETRKTKAMLLEEIEKKNDEIKELKKSVEKLDKYKMYDDDAGEIRALFDSFVNSGFSEEQSFEADAVYKYYGQPRRITKTYKARVDIVVK